MRILYFSRSYTTHDRRFLSELAQTPYEVDYLRLQDDCVRYESRPVPERVRELPPLGGGERLTSPETWIKLAPRLEKVLAETRPDLVHAGPVQSCAFLAALAEFRPLVTMSWGSDLLADAFRDGFWTWVTRYTLAHSDMVITDCSEVSETAGRIAGVPSDQILQFPWGVDTDAFRPGEDTLQVHSRPGWENSVVVICTRSWEPNYGVIPLLEAFRIAHQQNSRLRLLLIGDGSQRPEVESIVREWGLSRTVWLAGAVEHENLPEYFRSADLYASLAYSDGSSVSLLEAMATGLPVIATDRPSNREWISSNSNGILVPFGDHRRMASGLLELASMPPECRAATALANRAIIKRRADWPKNAKKLIDAYSRLFAADASSATRDGTHQTEVRA